MEYLLLGILQNVQSIVSAYGYLGIFILMTLESASLPIPSEVVLPVVGHLISTGTLNGYLATAVVLVASITGMAIDYTIAYYVGKRVVYKHLQSFRIKKGSLDAFDSWFNRNGRFAVFIGRMVPEVRGLVSFPAGFAQMPLKDFFLFSFLGAAIWDIALIAFGYYALSTSSLVITTTAIALFVIVLYIIYRVALSKIRKG